MPVRRIVPDLEASDVAASRELYVDVLGLEVAMDLGWVVTYAVPGSPKTQLTVVTEDATAEVRPAVSIEVDDVDAVHAEAVRRGYEIVHPLTDEAWGVRRFFVRDAGGNVLNILSHRT
jgi:catechol 2,3-dioxygenase-like lactoylglutathione lyase family enzyme